MSVQGKIFRVQAVVLYIMFGFNSDMRHKSITVNLVLYGQPHNPNKSELIVCDLK